MEANQDPKALLFTSGPTFARGLGNGDLGMVLHGDLMMANGTWRAGNLTAARQRAWVGISKDGSLEFGYGPLTPELEEELELFIGGLHAFTNTIKAPPSSYEGVYGEMNLADVRIITACVATENLNLWRQLMGSTSLTSNNLWIKKGSWPPICRITLPNPG